MVNSTPVLPQEVRSWSDFKLPPSDDQKAMQILHVFNTRQPLLPFCILKALVQNSKSIRCDIVLLELVQERDPARAWQEAGSCPQHSPPGRVWTGQALPEVQDWTEDGRWLSAPLL